MRRGEGYWTMSRRITPTTDPAVDGFSGASAATCPFFSPLRKLDAPQLRYFAVVSSICPPDVVGQDGGEVMIFARIFFAAGGVGNFLRERQFFVGHVFNPWLGLRFEREM